MKKLLLVVATALGASILKKNLDKSRSDKDLWAEATGSSTGTSSPEAPAAPAN